VGAQWAHWFSNLACPSIFPSEITVFQFENLINIFWELIDAGGVLITPVGIKWQKHFVRKSEKMKFHFFISPFEEMKM